MSESMKVAIEDALRPHIVRVCMRLTDEGVVDWYLPGNGGDIMSKVIAKTRVEEYKEMIADCLLVMRADPDRRQCRTQAEQDEFMTYYVFHIFFGIFNGIMHFVLAYREMNPKPEPMPFFDDDFNDDAPPPPPRTRTGGTRKPWWHLG